MINVRFFGVLRLKSGIRQLSVEADSVSGLLKGVAACDEAKKAGELLSEKSLRDCIVVVNGAQARLSKRLSDGDDVMIMTSAAGG